MIIKFVVIDVIILRKMKVKVLLKKIIDSCLELIGKEKISFKLGYIINLGIVLLLSLFKLILKIFLWKMLI